MNGMERRVATTLRASTRSPLKEMAEIWPEMSQEGREEVAIWVEGVLSEMPTGVNFGVAAALELLWVRMRLEDEGL